MIHQLCIQNCISLHTAFIHQLLGATQPVQIVGTGVGVLVDSSVMTVYDVLICLDQDIAVILLSALLAAAFKQQPAD
jgi:hypothetical protein